MSFSTAVASFMPIDRKVTSVDLSEHRLIALLYRRNGCYSNISAW